MLFQELSSCSILNQGPSFTKTHAVQKYEHDLREKTRPKGLLDLTNRGSLFLEIIQI